MSRISEVMRVCTNVTLEPGAQSLSSPEKTCHVMPASKFFIQKMLESSCAEIYVNALVYSDSMPQCLYKVQLQVAVTHMDFHCIY